MNSESPPIVIRIRYGDSAMDWNIEHPDMVTFENTLEAINQVVNEPVAVAAFEYEDEDGDRITVRSEEEMVNMIQQYLAFQSENGIFSEPLSIYPRLGKSACKRNIEGLKVQTNPDASTVQRNNKCDTFISLMDEVDSPMEQDQGSGSSRKKSGDIQEILACGNISEGDLHFLEMLGSGNCGTVYKALHRKMSMPMAIKVIILDCTVDAQKQILSELEVLYRCKSPFIISFYGAYFMENRISICTEFMDGGSLDQYGQIPEHILGRMTVSIVRGMQYLWSLKIMHRDVKPSNILVNTTGEVKLCDFGVSVQLVESIAKTFIGTNAYMAPEKIGGQDYTVQSEVWSLGISLFEMAVGRFPYETANKNSSKPLELLNSIVLKDPPQLPRGVFSDAFVDFVANCMQKVPSARPAPEALMKHAYIERYDDEKMEAIARWVLEKVEEIQRQKIAKKTSSA
ncbi:hypothetical protein LSH36_581g02041 [Paralvinella palmiformis]|uniref:mitogen-activated protein kinase kinase n=1 Tax=Paralvinella palmiformis TaxID=53620 RepID=A0AAD9J6D2_9ANNE|nr:hypothetical protein LSH36_581g02041 [Paralvinella palmiformis]